MDGSGRAEAGWIRTTLAGRERAREQEIERERDRHKEGERERKSKTKRERERENKEGEREGERSSGLNSRFRDGGCLPPARIGLDNLHFRAEAGQIGLHLPRTRYVKGIPPGSGFTVVF